MDQQKLYSDASMEVIIKTVSDFTKITVEDILSRRRTSEINEARQIFMYLSSRLYNKSNISIALFIDRTQQNVSFQLLNFDQQLRIYKGLKVKVEEIKNAII